MRCDRRPSGQAIVEFALVLPFLLLLLLGILEFGRVFAQYFALSLAMEHVSADAARLGGYSEELDRVLSGNAFPFFDSDQVTYTVNTQNPDGSVACSSGTCTCDYGQYVITEARYPVSIHILAYQEAFDIGVSHTRHCWRGGAP